MPYHHDSSFSSSMTVVPALEQIFAEHHAFVWRVVRGLGVPASEVDDVVQEVFIVLHRRRKELRVGDCPRGLLYGIARRVAGRQQRTSRRYTARLAAVATLPPRPPTADPERRALLEERATIVRTALDAMDDDKRIMFEMTQVEGMSIAHAADVLGVNVNTAYARARSARTLIKQAIARHHDEKAGQRVRVAR